MDGSGSYKGKAEGSNSSQGLWIASPAKTTLTEAKHIYWFESAYDAMAYYQLHQANDKDLRKAVFISTGGNPTVEQMRGVLTLSLPAKQHICFDTDLAGIEFAKNLQQEMYRVVRSTIEETPERKPYLDSVADGKNLDEGDIDCCPTLCGRATGNMNPHGKKPCRCVRAACAIRTTYGNRRIS